ncbi:MAG TPA: hypothetical protein VLC28_06945 [Flavitalea sp.]|nr:hypothetical protein [Flavitalea sp.]
MKRIFTIAFAAVALLSACKKNDHDSNGGVYKGPVVQVHEGKSWTWAEVNDKGEVQKLGISITNEALNSVPTGNDGHGGHDHENMENNFILKFHPIVGSSTPFNHVGMGWNPNGHEPETIYGIPHFDFHFYMITPEQVAAIPAYEQDSVKFKNVPGPDYFPPTYFNPGGGVPQMGVHWLDFTSPELSGARFNQTFIYGSYDGDVTFYEPMITLEFIKSTAAFERDIPQPAKVQKTGWYPTKLKLKQNEKTYDVILDGFVYRAKS